MTLIRLPLAILALCAMAWPAAAQSGGPAIAYTTANLNMRAGPGTNYPVITTVPYGGAVTVFGCTANFSWCDAAFANTKGWVSGRYLNYGGGGNYYGRPIPNAGVYVGVPRYNRNYPIYRRPPGVVRPYRPYYPPRRY
ncbi:SH3 domain-containing protein [Roseibium porphyridii]|uniref:SH3 domain-containing protein n=1 Tax=Roseibium porphyridii TaxID=2866279 RepID=A0ABY8F4Y9_9HYPH|nr:SH3 domain-containing protein [Roseibium sp. KMA01]WFE90494.1 SH3 domain-containing protein [Roseibium sp. KMA01]